MPVVSVIIPTCNRPESLKVAIKSVLVQTFGDLELIVVNDCGENDLGALISGMNDNRIKYLAHETNRGPSAARNTGIKAARGKYIACLDDDDIYYPGHLQTLVDFLETSEYKIAYADTFRTLQVLEKGACVTKRKDLFSFDYDPDRILIDNLMPPVCLLYEKSILEETGLFDESIRFGEDWDFCIRMSLKYPFGHVREVTSEYRWRLDGSNATSSGQMGFVEARERIYKKYESVAAGRPGILEMQRKTLKSERRQAEKGNWAKKEKLKVYVIKIIGLRGLDILYRLKLKLLG